MTKTLNHNLKPWVWVILILLVAFFIFCNYGCNVVKQEERKNTTAVNRVNANIELQDKVVSKWKDAHPEQKKEEIKISEPKTILVNVEKLIPDTGYRKKYRDSVLASLKSVTNCIETQKEAYDLGFDVAEQQYLKNKQKVICPPDTTHIFFMQDEINRQKDSNNNLRVQVGFNNGQIAELQGQIKAKGKTITNLWLVISGLIVIVCLLLYFSLKGIITKIPGMVSGVITKIKS